MLLFLGTVTSSIAKYTYFQTGEYLGEQVKLLPGTEAESIDKWAFMPQCSWWAKDYACWISGTAENVLPKVDETTWSSLLKDTFKKSFLNGWKECFTFCENQATLASPDRP